MSGYNTVLMLRRLEKECDEYGFMLCHPRHCDSGQWGQYVAIKPKDTEALPIYARDAELFAGTLEQLEVWLRGVEWARQYDELLRVSDDKKRKRKEQDVRNKQMVSLLKGERVPEMEK